MSSSKWTPDQPIEAERAFAKLKDDVEAALKDFKGGEQKMGRLVEEARRSEEMVRRQRMRPEDLAEVREKIDGARKQVDNAATFLRQADADYKDLKDSPFDVFLPYAQHEKMKGFLREARSCLSRWR